MIGERITVSCATNPGFIVDKKIQWNVNLLFCNRSAALSIQLQIIHKMQFVFN